MVEGIFFFLNIEEVDKIHVVTTRSLKEGHICRVVNAHGLKFCYWNFLSPENVSLFSNLNFSRGILYDKFCQNKITCRFFFPFPFFIPIYYFVLQYFQFLGIISQFYQENTHLIKYHDIFKIMTIFVTVVTTWKWEISDLLKRCICSAFPNNGSFHIASFQQAGS